MGLQPRTRVVRLSRMRICSFLPSATEILYALNLGESVAGITFECNHPPEAARKPVVVRTRLPHGLSAGEIDRTVNEFMSRGESLYQIDVEALRTIQPDLIVTQDLCRVCAASPGDLSSALAVLPRAPQVLSLNPRTLGDVWKDIRAVGEAADRGAEAEALVVTLERRVGAVEQAVRSQSRPKALCLEWLDPPFVAGHWVPEMVERAGGTDVMGQLGEPGFRSSWEKALASQAEVVVVMPCGYDLEQTMKELKSFPFPTGWDNLPAVRQQRVFAVDPSSYFSRPGPRLATGVEILGHLFHPERVPLAAPAGAVAPLYASHRAARS